MSITTFLRGCLLAVILCCGTMVYAEGAFDKLPEFSARATLKNYPNSDTILLVDVQKISYEPSGLAVNRDEYAIKILTEGGRKMNLQQKFKFNRFYNEFKLLMVEIIKPNGKKVVIDHQKRAAIAGDSSSMSSNIYDPDDLMLCLPLPELEVGDIIHIATEKRDIRSRTPGRWCHTCGLQSNEPILRYELEISEPKELPLATVVVKNEVKGTLKSSQRQENGRLIRRWEATDVPQIIPEPQMPELRRVAQRVLVSTVPDWQSFSKYYWNLSRPHLDAVSPELLAKVKELTANTKTEEEKIRAIFYFVSQQIHYTGLISEDKAPGYEPHDVRLTFANRRGVCRDKAALLVSMLERAGFKAYPVLIMDGDPKDEEAPNIFFNHAITAVEKSNGEIILMDSTPEKIIDYLPDYLVDCSYLIARPEGDKLRRVPIPADKISSLRVSTKSSYVTENEMRASSEITTFGVFDNIFRSFLAKKSPPMRQQSLSMLLKTRFANATLINYSVEPKNLNDMSVPLKITLEYKIIGIGSSLFKNIEHPMPELRNLIPMIEAKDFAISNRKYPLRFDFTFDISEHCEMEMSEVCVLKKLPDPARFSVADGKIVMSRVFSVNKNIVSVDSQIKVNTLEITAEQYAECHKMISEFTARSRSLPLVNIDEKKADFDTIMRTFNDYNSVLLSLDKKIKIISPTEWQEEYTNSRLITNYSGVKRHSELEINYTPDTTEVIVEGTVTSPNGTPTVISDKDIRILDHLSWSNATRYPRCKIMVVAIPGVEIGAKIDLKTIYRHKNKPFVTERYTFRNPEPTLVSSFVVEAPENFALKISRTPNNVMYTFSDVGHVVTHKWEQGYCDSIDEEPNQPPAHMWQPGITVSACSNKEYAKFLNELLEKYAKISSPELDAAAAELISSLPQDPREKVKAIRDFVARKIRAAGPSPAFLPLELPKIFEKNTEVNSTLRGVTGAGATFNAGYGHHADRACLLAFLLRKAGIECEFLAAYNLPFVSAAEKNMREFVDDNFSHILVYIPQLNCYLNDTDEYHALGSVFYDKSMAINLSNGKIVPIRAAMRFNNAIKWTWEINAIQDEEATATFTEEYLGTCHGSQKRKLTLYTPEEKKQYFEQHIAKIAPDAKIINCKEDFSAYPGKIVYTLRFPHFFQKIAEISEFELPGFSQIKKFVNHVGDDRKTPFWCNDNMEMSVNYSVNIPHDMAPENPGSFFTTCGNPQNLSATLSYNWYSNKLETSLRLKVKPDFVRNIDVDQIQEVQRKIGNRNLFRFVLGPYAGILRQ